MSSGPPSQLNHLVPLAPRLQAREAVRVRQVLIGMAPDLASGLVAYSRESIASLNDTLDKALLEAMSRIGFLTRLKCK